MQIDPNLLSKTVKALTPKQEVVTETQVRGTVVISQGNKYVRLDGSESGVLTPVIDVLGESDSKGFADGDRVLVLLKDHQAIVTKNISDGLQTKTAIEAKELADDAWTAAGQAKTAAQDAAGYARDAQNSADLANGILNDMSEAAAAANTTLTNVYADAEQASQSAQAAMASASSASEQAGMANVYANSALDQLGIVENIVGVLDLVSKNGDYQLTEDTEVQPKKWYFTRSGTSPNYVYSVVSNPSGDPHAQGWYELVGVDEAIQNYVSSQLVVDDSGLWLKTAGMQTKVLLSATDGVVLYGTDGTIVGKYGATAQIGDSAGFHIEMDGTKLGFYQGANEVAYISNNQLYITQSVVLQQMDLGKKVADGGLGQWSWKVHPNGQNPRRNNLNLKWIG